MNLEQDDRIFIAYHERGPKAIEDLELCVAAQNFQEHVNEAIKNEQEYQEEKRLIEERKKNKKWWEFWI